MEFNESNATKQELQDNEEYSKPQIFVDEMLKLYNQRKISLETLDDQIMAIIIGVNIVYFSLLISNTFAKHALFVDN